MEKLSKFRNTKNNGSVALEKQTKRPDLTKNPPNDPQYDKPEQKIKSFISSTGRDD
jgi:hypothetical protein